MCTLTVVFDIVGMVQGELSVCKCSRKGFRTMKRSKTCFGENQGELVLEVAKEWVAQEVLSV